MRAILKAGSLLFVLCLPSIVLGHGAGYEPVDKETVAVRFAYVLGEPMTGAEVEVRPPGTKTAHQVGRADAHGQFAFVPDRPGEWTITAEDDAGHQVKANIAVNAGSAEVETPHHLAVPPMWLLGGLLVSLLANAGLISALLSARRKTV